MTMAPAPSRESTATQPVRTDRGLALIVDDEVANRRLLEKLLQQEGFGTVCAVDGAEAVTLFSERTPDIVFMDVMMPGMDGYEATRRIKSLSRARFVPVIFLTALSDSASLARCIDAGGDDFLSKPFSIEIFKARVVALERIRELYRELAWQHDQLSLRFDAERRDEAMAERVFSHAIAARNVVLDGVAALHRSASSFSGDLVLTARLPDGGARLLVGDFTGHGLAAAIGALPVTEIFHAMSSRGADCVSVLEEINRKLCTLLPPDRFMAATLISVSGTGSRLWVWNGGMPPVIIAGAEGLHRVASHGLPLGIVPDGRYHEEMQVQSITPACRLLMMSDGLLEARDRAGVMFQAAGLDACLDRWGAGEGMASVLETALEAHCGAVAPDDDVTAVELVVSKALLVEDCVPDVSHGERARVGWEWSVSLSGPYLVERPPLGMMLESAGFLNSLGAHIGAIDTVVAELYSNAVEHGVLGLASSLKSSPDGFHAYYEQRARRIAAGWRGFVRLHISFTPLVDGGRVRIVVSDSGPGFDATIVDELERDPDPARPWGRGLSVVRKLCESLGFEAPGNRVIAVYRWIDRVAEAPLEST